jgi:membrane associated rhomboid family serine protease
MVTLFFVGNAIKSQYGNKYIWYLYLTGALFGAICMNTFMPYNSIVIPQVGADSAISAFLTFYGLLNPHQSIMIFVFPVKFWVLLAIMGAYSFIGDPTKKNCGGMIAGLMIYQMMRMRFI